MAHILKNGTEPIVGKVYILGNKKLECKEDTASEDITCVGCYFFDTVKFPTADRCQSIKCSESERVDGKNIILKKLVKEIEVAL